MAFFLLAVMNFPKEFCAGSSAMISNPAVFGCGINATKCNEGCNQGAPAVFVSLQQATRPVLVNGLESLFFAAPAPDFFCAILAHDKKCAPVHPATLWRLHARMV
ncbi:hypothetical protein [Herbaspirillum sp. NPDC101397]|uniref:hypothetical protein n=1 Tax=Herbaspirillum sp. NPDC101397 TaxID=3364006 RepID=UPI00383A47EC